MSANDEIADLFTEHALDLQRFDAGQRRAVRRWLKELEDDLVAQLTRSDIAGAARTATKQRRLERLLAQVRESIRASYRREAGRLASELRELADIEGEATARMVNQGVGFDLMDVEITREQARAIVEDTLIQGAPVREWWQRQAGDAVRRFQDQMRLGIAEGESNAKLVRRIRGGTVDGVRVEGFMQVKRHQAESLVRSATQAVAQRAREETYRQNRRVISSVIWLATLDTRTTLGCAARDNRRYNVETKEPIGHNFPWEGGPGNRHWGCRSTSAPVTKSWRALGIDRDELPPATRASMDGQAPADTSFEAWLSRQSRERQAAVLGEGRAELWREGNLTFRDLIDGTGRELTIEELRQKVRARG